MWELTHSLSFSLSFSLRAHMQCRISPPYVGTSVGTSRWSGQWGHKVLKGELYWTSQCRTETMLVSRLTGSHPRRPACRARACYHYQPRIGDWHKALWSYDSSRAATAAGRGVCHEIMISLSKSLNLVSSHFTSASTALAPVSGRVRYKRRYRKSSSCISIIRQRKRSMFRKE